MTTPGSNEDHRLQTAQSESKDALAQMIDAYRDYLLRIASQELDSALKAKGGASDLVQETMLEAIRDFAQFQGGKRELRAWLRQLLRNNLINFARRYKETQVRPISEEIPLGAGSSNRPPPALMGEDPTPSQILMEKEQAEAVEKAVSRLPADYRQVILLRYREELSFEEISRIMGRSANAVEKLWLRAVERLRQEVSSLLNSDAFMQRMKQVGIEIHPMSTDEFERFMREERGRWAEVVQKLNVKID